MILLRRALCLLTFIVGTASAYAETVAILRPANPSAEMTQALTLVRGELLSVGLDVTTWDRASARGASGADSAAWLAPFAARGVSAIVEAIGDDSLEAVDVWMLRTQSQRFEVTRVAVNPREPTQPEVLALRAVEALRAGLLQTDWAARKRRNEPVREAPAATLPVSASQTTSPMAQRLGIEAGAAGVMSFDGLGPALLPTARATWAVRPSVDVQASAAGLGTRSKVSGTTETAQVAQQYALLGARHRWHSNHRVWPFVGLAAGVLHTSVEGLAGWGTGGHRTDRWSLLADASLGAGARLFGRSYVTLAAHAQVAAPYVAIYLLDTEGATSGRPNVLLTLTVGAWL